MKKLLITTLIFLLFVNGCNKESNEQEAVINNETIPTLQASPEDNSEESLNKIGISTEGEKIIIDTNRTKKFLESMAKKLQSEAVRIAKEAKKIKSEDLGIHKERDKVTIDLNKTKQILKGITKQLEGVAKSLQKTLEDQVK